MTPGQAAIAKAIFFENGIIPDGEYTTADERQAELWVHQVLGSLMQRVPTSIRIGEWIILHRSIDVRLGSYGTSDHQHRAHMMMLAEQFNLAYAEGQINHDPDRNVVVATGHYEGVPVKFWRYVAPCTCGECGARQ